MAHTIGGVAYVYVDGEQLALRGELTIEPTMFERTGVAGQDRVHGNIVMPRVPKITGNFSTIENQGVESIDAMEDVVVTAECANGVVYTLSEAWSSGSRSINTAQGQFQIVWEGKQMIERRGVGV